MTKVPENSKEKTIQLENRQLVLSLMTKFNELMPDEESSRAWLYQQFEERGLLKCSSCPDAEYQKITHRLIQCKRCRRKIWVTAGTMFHGVRHIRPYLAALFCRGHGAMFGAPWFARLFQIADSSAGEIAKKIALLLINSQLDNEVDPVHSVFFKSIIIRRSRETPARENAIAELDTLLDSFVQPPANLQSHSQDRSIQAGGSFNDKNTLSKPKEFDYLSLPDDQKCVLGLLSNGPVSFDLLYELSGMSAGELTAVLMMLTMDGLVIESSIGNFERCGSVYNQCARASEISRIDSGNTETEGSGLPSTMELLTETVKQISGGVSRKCLQIYSALFGCHRDRVRWNWLTLLSACLHHPPIRYIDVLSYVSAPTIKVIRDANL